MQWAAFEQVFGPLTVQERVDQAAVLIANALGATVTVDDLLPRPTQSADDMIAVVRALQAKRKKG
jgi:hypothetical protein